MVVMVWSLWLKFETKKFLRIEKLFDWTVWKFFSKKKNRERDRKSVVQMHDIYKRRALVDSLAYHGKEAPWELQN